MRPTQLLFLHGAGGYAEDHPLAEALGSALGVRVDMPQLPDDDMSFETWAATVRSHVRTLNPDDLLVAHSFGASILLKVLAEGVRHPRASLLAMPDWGPEGWDVSEYAFYGPEPATQIVLHHCRDDEIVPFPHLARHAARLPSARIREHATGGHQFDGLMDAIAADAGW